MEIQSPGSHLTPESRESTGALLPEISIPSEWFPSYSSHKEDVLVRPFRGRCGICGWDGVPETLLLFNHFALPKLHRLRHSDCVSCRILLVACESALMKIDVAISKHVEPPDSDESEEEGSDVAPPDSEESEEEEGDVESLDSDESEINVEPSDSDESEEEETDVEIILWGDDRTTRSAQNLPCQRVVQINVENLGASLTRLDRVGIYIFVPVGEYSREPPCGLPTKRVFSAAISSTTSASWARQRLERCSRSHKECSSAGTKSFLPTRLVSINPRGRGGNVQLVEGRNLPHGTRYAALSYVWGPAELQDHSKTTRGTLSSQLEEIEFSSLPKTLQDAIVFTRDLGLDFLWVDSLCIVQNDIQEWSREAGRMYDVYKNSFVMLGALWSHDCDSGLFGNFSEWQSQPVATLRLGENTWPLHFSRQHDVIALNHKWCDWTPPLLTRAWCFQERMVPPRCVFFGRSELIFGCHEGVDCECGIAYSTAMHPHLGRDESSACGNAQLVKPPEQKHGLRWLDQSPERAWRQVVEEYCGLGLSAEKDRLVAVGAVAEQLSYARPGDKYLAGMWAATLLVDLCWWVPSGNWCQDNRSCIQENIPSWSWASRGKNISYQGVNEITPVAELIEYRCTYEENNPFGIISDSKLVLRGRIMNWSPHPSATQPSRLKAEQATSPDGLYGSNGTFIPFRCLSEDCDFARDIPPGSFLFDIGYFSGNEMIRVFLFLRCQDEENFIFSREGILNPAALGGDNEDDGDDDNEAEEMLYSLTRAFNAHSSVQQCTII